MKKTVCSFGALACIAGFANSANMNSGAVASVAGGVSANSGLRRGVVEMGRRRGWRTFIPELKFTTDNAAMIATAGYYRYMAGELSSLDVAPVARIQDL